METGRISEGADGSSGPLSSGSANGESGQFRIDNSYSVSGALKPPLAGSKKGFFPSFFQRLTGPEPACAKALKTGSETGLKIVSKTALQGPKTTVCMIRPGSSVNRPAMTSAPVKV